MGSFTERRNRCDVILPCDQSTWTAPTTWRPLLFSCPCDDTDLSGLHSLQVSCRVFEVPAHWIAFFQHPELFDRLDIRVSVAKPVGVHYRLALGIPLEPLLNIGELHEQTLGDILKH